MTEGTLDRITGADLLAISGEIDVSVTERTMEFWRREGLLPRPERTGQAGKQPVWTYPHEATEQLRKLLQLRRKTKNPNTLRVALWYQGYDIEITRVRASMLVYLQGLQSALGKQLQKHLPGKTEDDGIPLGAIESVASILARKRGKGVIRAGRQSLNDRTQAVTLLLSLVAKNDSTQDLAAYAPALERMTGLDRGRRRIAGIPAWLDGPPEQITELFQNFANFTHLISVLDSATDEELELARGLGQILLDGLVTSSKIIDAIVGRENSLGIGGLRALEGNPEVAAVWVPLVLSVLQSPDLRKNVESLVKVLQESVVPVGQQVQEIANLAEEERSQRLANLSNLRFGEQLMIRRALSEFTDKS